MTRRDIIGIATALSYEQLEFVARSVQCPVHGIHANVIVDANGFTLYDACCERLKPVVQEALMEYKLVVQRKFLRDVLH